MKSFFKASALVFILTILVVSLNAQGPQQCSDYNCLSCPSHPSICTNCKSGFYMSGGSCSSCRYGCQICYNGSSCSMCKSGYFLDDSNNCQSCRYPCNTCTDYNTCTS